jgi:hypothetical protein
LSPFVQHVGKQFGGHAAKIVVFHLEKTHRSVGVVSLVQVEMEVLV